MSNCGEHNQQSSIPDAARTWLIAGSITGGLSVAILAALIGYAASHNPPLTVATMILGMVNLLLGTASIKLICDASTMVRIHRSYVPARPHEEHRPAGADSGLDGESIEAARRITHRLRSIVHH